MKIHEIVGFIHVHYVLIYAVACVIAALLLMFFKWALMDSPELREGKDGIWRYVMKTEEKEVEQPLPNLANKKAA